MRIRSPRNLAAMLLVASLAPTPTALAIPLATPAPPTWVHQAEGSGRLLEIALSPDNATVYAAGERHAQIRSAHVSAHDAETGALRWSFTSSRSSSISALAVSPDGRVVLIGGHSWHKQRKNEEMTVWALDAADGTPLWSRTHVGDGALREGSVRDVTFSKDGSRVFAGGVAWYANRRRDFVVLAYESRTGRLAWKRVHDSGASGSRGQSDEARALTLSGDGSSVVATGIGRWPAGREAGQVLTMALNARTGVKRWLRYDRPAGQTHASQGGVDVATMGGGLFLATQTNWRHGFGSGAVAASRLRSSDGRSGWRTQMPTPSEADGCRIRQIDARDGVVHAMGTCRPSNGPSSITMWSRFASSGAARWVSQFGTWSEGNAMSVTDDQILVTGWDPSEVNGRHRLLLVAFDPATGSSTVAGELLSTQGSFGEAMAAVPAGDVAYVAGQSDGRPIVVRFDMG